MQTAEAVEPAVPVQPRPAQTRLVRARRKLLTFWERTKRITYLILLVPVGYAGMQVWHRVADAFGSRPVRMVRPFSSDGTAPTIATPEFRSALAALTETTMVPGHQLELLINGRSTLARVEADFRAARSSIEVQNYYCETGRVTEWLKELLILKAREGLKVLFLRDGFGCRNLTQGYVDSLTSAGVEIATVRPIKWYSMHSGLHRSHVRSITIDGSIGYTGGFGLADKWLNDEERPGWRETTVRFTGPAVAQLAGAFAIGWADATGQLLAGEGIFAPPAPTDSGAVAGVMFTMRTYGTPVPERYLALTLAGAQRTAYIANPYFIPNKELRSWLVGAARRGVDVRVLAASENIDHLFTHYAARSTYKELLEGGVKIYEYLPAMMHAKTMVIDGVFGSVGSLNLDNVSLRINDEVVLLVQDTSFASTLESQFLEDIAHARVVTLETLENRSTYERVMTWAARLMRDFL